jgi:hypothetical protein
MLTSGYYPRRRGVLEHIRDGRMSLLDNSFHDLLCLIADPATGIARTSAAHLHFDFGISRILAQKYLIRLESKGYIRRFRKARSKSRQIVLIHLYECTALPQKGMILNALATADWRQCVYEPVSRAVSRAVSRGVSTARLVYIENLNRSIELEKTPAAGAASPSNPAGQIPQTEKRRRVDQRTLRLAREMEAFKEAHVGEGPFCEVRGRFYTAAMFQAEFGSPQPPAEKPSEVSTAVLTSAVLQVPQGQTPDAPRYPEPGSWKQALALVEKKLNPHTFGTWFRPTDEISCAGGRMVIRVPSPLFIKRITVTYAALLQGALIELGWWGMAIEVTCGSEPFVDRLAAPGPIATPVTDTPQARAAGNSN